MTIDIVIGLGANLGDQRASLVRARSEIQTLGRLVRSSALYETPPVGPPQPDFLNAAVRLETERTPEALLDALLDVERALGRVRLERLGPRTIDLDILWGQDLRVESERLLIPHPELEKRAFALVPLLDVAPEAASPVGISYRAIAATLDLTVLREVFGSRDVW